MNTDLRRFGWALVFALVGVAVILTLYALNQIGNVTDAIRSGQTSRAPMLAQTNHAAHAAERGTRIIRDCTTPGRPCFEEGQRRTARAIGDLIQGNQQAAAAAASCAANIHPPTYRAIYRCVVHTLAEH